MSKQLSTSRRTVALAAVLVIVTAAAFGASFYLLDGVTYARDAYVTISDTVAGLLAGNPQGAAPSVVPTASVEATFTLPPGMSKEFALRLWQEQVDSQEMISRLADGDVTRLEIGKVTKQGDATRLDVAAASKDTTLSGAIGLKRYGNADYVSYVASSESRIPPKGALPDVSDVDVALLNTMLEQNAQSQAVIDEYIGGIVKEVVVTKRTPGPRTMTLELRMNETHGTGFARMVLVKSEHDGKDMWFITRFKKTGHDPANL